MLRRRGTGARCADGVSAVTIDSSTTCDALREEKRTAAFVGSAYLCRCAGCGHTPYRDGTHASVAFQG